MAPLGLQLFAKLAKFAVERLNGYWEILLFFGIIPPAIVD
jgi:hypothetical protein